MKSKFLLSLILSLMCFFISKPSKAQHIAVNDFSQIDIPKAAYQTTEISLKATLQEIEQKFNVSIAYKDELVKDKYLTVSIARCSSLSDAFQKVLTPFNLSFEKIRDHFYLISLSKPVDIPRQQLKYKQETLEHTVRGKVTDSTGKALPGVSVKVKGTNKGAVTNAEGEYIIEDISDSATLVFSYIGYVTNEILIGERSTVDIILHNNDMGLGEVVVIGYGKQKKASVTAAIATLKGEDIATTPISDLSNGLGGRVPGVIFRQGSGQPGRDGSGILIRGISTTGSTQPLLVVDGIPRDFQQLDPNTIESFTVLKDAAAVAPYGVAGANGVILVTTKRGKTGTPSLTYNGYVGFQNPTILPKWVNAYQFATLRNAASENEGLPDAYTKEEVQKFKDGSDPDAYPDPHVYDIVTRNAIITSHNIELSGGTEKIKFYTSLGYQYQAGMWPTTNENRYNLTIDLDAQATQTTKISFNVIGRVQNNVYPFIGQSRIFELIAYTRPDRGPLYFSNGMPGTKVVGDIFNDGYQKENTTALYSQLSIEQDLPFIPGLKIKGTIAYDPTIIMDKVWAVPFHMGTLNKSQQPYVITDGVYDQTQYSLTQSFNNSYQLTYQTSLNYSRSFGKSNLGALAVFEAKANNGLGLGASRTNYSIPIDEISMGSSNQADMTTMGSSSMASQVGIVYRVNYEYASKYLLEASGRYDGSYYFSPGKQFGFFPAFSIGWRLSEENFIKKNVNWIDNLKLRGSYGEVGALAGNPFQYLSTYNAYGPAYVIGGNAVQGLKERPEPDVNITWERAKKADVGLDAMFWRGLLSIEADYYYEKRSNMLVTPDVVVPSEYGIGLSQVNAGIMKNQGVDFSISSSYNISKDLQVSLSGNFTYAKNTLLQVFESPSTYNNPNRRLTGRPLGSQFGLDALGFFQPSDFDENDKLKDGIAIQPWGAVQPGDIRYKDMNGDNKINDDDLTQIGDAPTPQIIYGIIPHIRYKGFMLDILFQGAAKSSFYLDGSSAWAFYNGRNAYVDNLDYWTPNNPNAKNPRITSAPTVNNTQVSSFWMRSTNYLRLKSGTLAYTIPTNLVQKLKMQNARIYTSVQNLITWSQMPNYDPETFDGYTNYPQQKVISVGLSVTF